MFQSIDRRGYAAFKAATLGAGTKVVSVDVFDTLLLRGTKPESARFLDIGRRHLHALKGHGAATSLTHYDLLIKRLAAARAAYRNARLVDGVREPNYRYIANIQLRSMGLTPTDDIVSQMLELELEYEASVLKPNRTLVNILKAAKHAGKRVICVSDMYLGAGDIERLVRQSGIGFIDKVYSSSDFGFGKASKRLFESVLELEGVEPSMFVHCGDNAFSDFRNAVDLGIDAYHVPRAWNWRLADKARKQMFNWRHRLDSL